MKRLTVENVKSCCSVGKNKGCIPGGVCNGDCVAVRIERLRLYENTHLSPDEILALQKQNAELKELLRLAGEDLEMCADCATCKPFIGSDCYGCMHDENNWHIDEDNWQWRHAEKAEALGVEL